MFVVNILQSEGECRLPASIWLDQRLEVQTVTSRLSPPVCQPQAFLLHFTHIYNNCNQHVTLLKPCCSGCYLEIWNQVHHYYRRYKCEKCVAKVVSNRKSKHNKRPKLPLSLYSMHSEKERNNQVSNQPVNRFNRPSQPYSSPSSQHQSPSLKPLPN